MKTGILAVLVLVGCGSSNDFGAGAPESTGGNTQIQSTSVTGGASQMLLATGGKVPATTVIGGSIGTITGGSSSATGGAGKTETGGASSACVTGTVNCPCYSSGVCSAGLACNASKICSPVAGGSGGAAASGGSASTGGATSCPIGTLGCLCDTMSGNFPSGCESGLTCHMEIGGYCCSYPLGVTGTCSR